MDIKLIKEVVNKMSFMDAYNFLQEEEIGCWDNVNDTEIIKQYCQEMINKGIMVAHILEVLEQNPSKYDLYQIWLGNSMETPNPINTVEELLDALEV